MVAPAGGVTFTWDREDSGLYNLLAKNSILFDIRPASEAFRYPAVVIPPSAGSIAVPPGVRAYAPAAGAPPEEILARIRALAPDSLAISVEGAPHVIGNLTRLGSGKGLAIHLLNYAPRAVSGLKVRLRLDREFAPLAAASPRAVTPDALAVSLRVRRSGSDLEITLDNLDVYSVLILEKQPRRGSRPG